MAYEGTVGERGNGSCSTSTQVVTAYYDIVLQEISLKEKTFMIRLYINVWWNDGGTTSLCLLR